MIYKYIDYIYDDEQVNLFYIIAPAQPPGHDHGYVSIASLMRPLRL